MSKPFIKWLGGKRSLLPGLSTCISMPIQDYYEPFVGGGALFFFLKENNLINGTAYLNDINPYLIKAYEQVRDNVNELIDLLEVYKQSHCKEFYYAVRKQWNDNRQDPCLYDVEIAASFIYLNKTGFNGLYRENKKGEYNVPFGDYKNPLICDVETLLDCSRLLQGVKLTCSHYPANVRAKQGDFVYIDPPYIPVSSTSNFTGYSKGGFNEEDHLRLRYWMAYLISNKVNVIQSNSASPLTYELYSCKNLFELIEIKAKRSVAAKTESRKDVKELLILGAFNDRN